MDALGLDNNALQTRDSVLRPGEVKTVPELYKGFMEYKRLICQYHKTVYADKGHLLSKSKNA